MSAEEVTIKIDELKALFDMVANSLDFGSGFLETDDVVLLRRVAVMIGVDPMRATPRGFATQYPHAYQDPGRYADLKCDHCRRRQDDSIHVTAEATDGR